MEYNSSFCDDEKDKKQWKGNRNRNIPAYIYSQRPMTTSYAPEICCSDFPYYNERYMLSTPQQHCAPGPGPAGSCYMDHQIMASPQMSYMEQEKAGYCKGKVNGYSFRPRNMNKRNLIVNYLPQSFNDEHLFALFIPYGPIQSVKIMKETKSGYSYGFGFVNYVREEDALVAIQEMNGFQVQDKRLKVSVARPPSDDIKDTNVYITNLPRHYTEVELCDLFGRFGEIVQRHVLRDKTTNLSRGAAFVRFDVREQASQAIHSMNGAIPEGSSEPIRVKLAQDHGKQKAAYVAGYQDAMCRRRPPPSSRNFEFISS